MKRKVCCARDLVEGARGATGITYLGVGGPKADNPRPTFKELLFCLLWLTKRSRVSDIAKIFV
jgi:hypothetical protein